MPTFVVIHCFVRVTPGRFSTFARFEPARAFMSEDVQQQLVDLNQTQTLCDSYDDAVTMLSDLYGSYHEVAESLNILAEGR